MFKKYKGKTQLRTVFISHTFFNKTIENLPTFMERCRINYKYKIIYLILNFEII